MLMKQKIVAREHRPNKFGLHLVSFVPFLPKPENIDLLTNAFNNFKQFTQLNDKAIVEEMINSCPGPIVQKQLAFMLRRHQFYLDEYNIELFYDPKKEMSREEGL